MENYYSTMDVMFLQEANVVKWNISSEYQIAENYGSIVIFKTSVFGHIDEKLTKMWQPLFNFNEDSVAVITQKPSRNN